MRARDADDPSSRWASRLTERNTEVLCCSAERHHMIIPANKNGISFVGGLFKRVSPTAICFAVTTIVVHAFYLPSSVPIFGPSCQKCFEAHPFL